MFKPGHIYVHKKAKTYALYSTFDNKIIVIRSKHQRRIGEDATKQSQFPFYDEFDEKSSIFQEEIAKNNYFSQLRFKEMQDNTIKKVDNILSKAKDFFKETDNNFI